MDEDPKTLKVLPIPLHDENGTTLHYDLLSLSPDGKILAATHGSTLQWLCAETGQVLDVAEKAHDGKPKFFIFLISNLDTCCVYTCATCLMNLRSDHLPKEIL